MAAEMVIWANLERMLGGPEVAMLLPLKKELGKLLAVVLQAEGAVADLQGRDQMHGVLGNQDDELSNNLRRGRLEYLSTLLYQADDLLDKILTIDQRTKLYRGSGSENGSHLVQQVLHVVARSTQEVSIFLSSSNQLVFPTVMAGRVAKIRKDLENLVGQLSNQLDSTNQPEQRQVRRTVSFRQPRQRMPGRNDDKKKTLTGRKEDKRNIVTMLLQPSWNKETNVSIICMSGLPGVGKSALAKDIYEDDKVKSHFDLRMWIPVAHITDEKDIIRQIVESCSNKRTCSNSLVHQSDAGLFGDFLGCRNSSISISSPTTCGHQNEIEIHERRLKNEIRDKHYLLILDDVGLQTWQSLRNLLAGGARGSKILMTTRNADLSNIVKRETPEVQAYPLKGLKEQHSWKLFRALALDQDKHYDAEIKGLQENRSWKLFRSLGLDQDERGNAEAKILGLEIANICQHIPLTIKVAARLLHGKSRDKWLPFVEGLRLLSRDQVENVVEHVIHLSYSDLPNCLRACFVYCSLFPDDYTFNKHDLISLWIAQGFVNPDDGRSLEDAGEKYFMELSRRSLLKEVKTDDLGNILTCKMHHIICNLASKFAAGITPLQLTESNMICITDPASKHVSVNCRGDSLLKLSSPLPDDPSLRTLIFVKEPECYRKVDKFVCKQLISTYRRLRVLDLHDLGLEELPDSIGGQIHLRYLDLSKNDGLVTLPKSFTRLCNLQTLKLNYCPKLKNLAIDFGQLVNLNRFEVHGCESLTSMPLGLEKLTKLETLSRFVVGNGSSKQTTCGELKALRGLTMLRGRLAIELTGDWMVNIPEAKQALYTKEYLVELKISWAQTPSDVQLPLLEREPLEKEISAAHGEILENLKPNKNLKVLHIEGYKGNYFPSWANKEMMSSLPNLVIISIEGCSKCQFLPPFGELAHLRKLTLRHMAKVQFIEEVNLLDPAVGGSLEPSFFKSLRELTLHNFYSLKGWREEVATIQQIKPRSFPCLSKLRIWNCPKLTSFPSFAEVLDLNLRNVNHMLLEECAKKARKLKSKFDTRSLQIKCCVNLEGFRPVRKGLGGLPSLKHLVIEDCDAMISLAREVGKISSLESLEISSCKELDLSLHSMTPVRGHAVFEVPSVLQSSWKNLKSLRELKLREIPKMENLPDGLKHVITLKSLCISACQSLGSLPDWISSLTALQHLRIENCRALKMLPEGLKDISSLMKVEITECPELTKRCREHTGEDWPKIKHARVLLHKSRRYGYV